MLVLFSFVLRTKQNLKVLICNKENKHEILFILEILEDIVYFKSV